MINCQRMFWWNINHIHFHAQIASCHKYVVVIKRLLLTKKSRWLAFLFQFHCCCQCICFHRQTKCNVRHFLPAPTFERTQSRAEKSWPTVLILEQRIMWNWDFSVKSLCDTLILTSELEKKIVWWSDNSKMEKGSQRNLGFLLFILHLVLKCCNLIATGSRCKSQMFIFSFQNIYFLPDKRNLCPRKDSKAAWRPAFSV